MKTKSTDITFISLPPSLIAIPSPSFSVLKSYLLESGIKSNIIYANHYIEKEIDFFKEEGLNGIESFLPFLYLNKNNSKNKEYLNIYFKSFFPDLFLTDRTLSNEVLNDLICKCDEIINNIIDEIRISNVKIIGFTSKFNQWIPAIVVAQYIKLKFPHIKIVIGGWSSSQAAYDFLSINSEFDYSIWGEGEIPLLQLVRHVIDNNCTIDKIPRLVYRVNGQLTKGISGNINTYVNFNKNSPFPNFDDFFISSKKIEIKNIIFPIEGGRGCNWNSCSFCYLSQGYKYKVKDPSTIIKEIEFQINKYNKYAFFFTDNDVVGKNLSEFNRLLDGLILLKEKHPHFEIIMAEIISYKIDIVTIKKMNAAGFKNVQVGLESISESNLIDINKKQSIVENFFFIKHSLNNGINIKGANIIVDTPNENDTMIMETINNLHKYRFILNSDFNFSIIPLGVANSSKYLKTIKERKEEHLWTNSDLIQIIPEEYYTKIDRFSLLTYINNASEKPLWNLFYRILNFYKRKKFNYTVEYNETDQSICYNEYSDKEIIKDILIDNLIQVNILKLLFEKILTADELYESLCNLITLNKEDFLEKLAELIDEDLVFMDNATQSVVSVIDVK